MSLETPIQIRTLQRKLYLKAKAEPAYRFYLLYDKIYREDILAHAYQLVKANQGAPGVDGQTFWGIETQGWEKWLAGIRDELRAKTYQPQPVRRVMIPKPGGGERPLGIPTIRDRVVDTDDSGSSGTDCRQAGAGANLRGGFRPECLWLSTETERAGCDPESTSAFVQRLHGCSGR
jgi:hypothetical protein